MKTPDEDVQRATDTYQAALDAGDPVSLRELYRDTGVSMTLVMIELQRRGETRRAAPGRRRKDGGPRGIIDVTKKPAPRRPRTENHRQVSDARRRARVGADLYEMTRWAESHWKPISRTKAAAIARCATCTLYRELKAREVSL